MMLCFFIVSKKYCPVYLLSPSPISRRWHTRVQGDGPPGGFQGQSPWQVQDRALVAPLWGEREKEMKNFQARFCNAKSGL